MVNKSILKRTGQRPDYHENNLQTATSESTISVFDGPAFILSDVESTAQIENTQISPIASHRLFRPLGLLIGIFGRVLNWLNGTGSSQIDIHRIETRNDQHLGLRKWNL